LTGANVVAERKRKRRPNGVDPAESYARRLASQTEANRRATLAARDFGKLPKIGNPKRKAAAKKSLRVFCERYLPLTFDRPWSPDHLLVIDRMERAVCNGGCFAVAMPRGSGKTSITEAAALWAVLFGFRRFVFLIGATETHAEDLLASIKTEIESNDELLADFPAVCLPVRRLEGVTTRRLVCDGNRVRLKWTGKEINLPWIDGKRRHVGGGAVIQVRGITGALRGAKAKLPTGETIRPDLAIPDDPETDESARSPAQVADREAIIAGAVLGLAGPGKKIAAVLPCTVIADGSMADRMLSLDLHPEWGGVRVPFIKAFPDDRDRWETYAELRAESLREHQDIRTATKYYRANRAAMDAGAVVSWKSRYEPDELSAIQFGMNKLFSDARAFWAELQNAPRQEGGDDVQLQTAKAIAERGNGGDRLDAMAGTEVVTGMIDVQQRVLYYTLVGWRADFTGGVLDYGTFPEQRRDYYTLADCSHTLQKKFPGRGVEGAITGGLSELVARLCGRTYRREDDGAELSPSLILVDSNWQTATVRDFCRRLRSTTIVPCHGRYVGASNKPITEYKKGRGERVGLGWKSSTIERLKHVLFDANLWKSFIHERLGIAFGDRGSLTFWGSEPTRHRMLAEHLISEYRVRTTNNATGRTVDEWKLKASRPDNHLLDTVVGAAVAASIMGVELSSGVDGIPARPKQRRRRRIRYG